jgi:hypothetical protein
MVLLCTAKLLAYVHHVICQEHKVRGNGLRTSGGRELGDRDREGLSEGKETFPEGWIES